MGQRYVDWLPSYGAHNFLFVMLAIAVLLTICQLLADDLILLWTTHRRSAILATVGIAIALTGGMGVETLGYKLFQGHTESIWYKVEVAVEEFMEMLGASLVLVSALKVRFQKTADLRHVKKMSFTLAGQKIS